MVALCCAIVNHHCEKPVPNLFPRVAAIIGVIHLNCDNVHPCHVYVVTLYDSLHMVTCQFLVDPHS